MTADCSEVHGLDSGVPSRRGSTASLVLGVWLLLVPLPVVGCRHVSDLPASTGTRQEPSALAKAPAPHTLEEALATLAAHASPELLALVQERTEDAAMAELHLGFGTWLRNEWGLWKRGPLYDDLARRGLHDPEDMSSVILTSFWRQQHGHPIDVEGQLEQHERYYETQRALVARDTERRQRTAWAVRAMTEQTRFATVNAPRLRLGKRTGPGLRVTSLATYRAGILLGVEVWDSDGDRERIEPFHLDARDMTLRPVRISELGRIHSFTVVKGTCWVVGLDGARPVLVEVDARDRTARRLPREHELPRLSTYGDALLLIYEDAMYQLTSEGWSAIPIPGAIPREATAISSHGQRIYYMERDAVDGENRLRWVESTGRGLSSDVPAELSRQMGELTPSAWTGARSYAVAPTGHLWLIAGYSFGGRSLLERDANGYYRAHVVAPLVDATSDAPTLSALTFDGSGMLVAAGPDGVYRLHGGALTTLVSIENTVQHVTEGRDVLHWEWQPEHLVAVGEGKYVVAGAEGGIYVVTLSSGDRASIRAVDDRIGRPLRM